jgi:hypothetical protein
MSSMRGLSSLEHVERDWSVQDTWAQREDMHHWNMLREIYLYRVGELNERTYIIVTCWERFICTGYVSSTRGHTSLEHVERDLSVQGRWAQWEGIHHWNMLREMYLCRVGELNERTYIIGTTCSNDVCPLVELTYPVQINLSQHVPMMYVLSFSSPTLYR